jgi:hypothetical protein
LSGDHNMYCSANRSDKESIPYRTFEDWFYELEQHNTRACRLWAELDYNGEQYNVIKEWLKAAYEAGVDKELK